MAMFEQDEWDLALLDELLLKAEQETSARKSATASNFPSGGNTGFQPQRLQPEKLAHNPATLGKAVAAESRFYNQTNQRLVGNNITGISEQSRGYQNQWPEDNVAGMAWPSNNPRQQPGAGPQIAQNQIWRESARNSNGIYSKSASARSGILGNGEATDTPSHVQQRHPAYMPAGNPGGNARTSMASPAPFANRSQSSTRHSPSRPSSSRPLANRNYGGTGASAAGNRRFGALFPTNGPRKGQGAAASALSPGNGHTAAVSALSDQPTSMAVGSDVWEAHDLQFMEMDTNAVVDKHQPVESSAPARQSTLNLTNGYSAGEPVQAHSEAATSAGERQGAEMARQNGGTANEVMVQSLQQELADKNARIARLEAELIAMVALQGDRSASETGLTPDKRPSPNHQQSVSNDPVANGTPPGSVTTPAVVTTPEGPSVGAATTEAVAPRIAAGTPVVEEAGEYTSEEPAGHQAGISTPPQQQVTSAVHADKRSAMKAPAAAVLSAPATAGMAAIASGGVRMPADDALPLDHGTVPSTLPPPPHSRPEWIQHHTDEEMAFSGSNRAVTARDADRLVLQTQLAGIWQGTFAAVEAYEDGGEGGQQTSSAGRWAGNISVVGDGANKGRYSEPVVGSVKERSLGVLASAGEDAGTGFMDHSGIEPLSVVEKQDEEEDLTCSAFQLPAASASAVLQLMMLCSGSLSTLLARLPFLLEPHLGRNQARGSNGLDLIHLNAAASVRRTSEREGRMLGSNAHDREVEEQQCLVNLWETLRRVLSDRSPLSPLLSSLLSACHAISHGQVLRGHGYGLKVPMWHIISTLVRIDGSCRDHLVQGLVQGSATREWSETLDTAFILQPGSSTLPLTPTPLSGNQQHPGYQQATLPCQSAGLNSPLLSSLSLDCSSHALSALSAIAASAHPIAERHVFSSLVISSADSDSPPACMCSAPLISFLLSSLHPSHGRGQSHVSPSHPASSLLNSSPVPSTTSIHFCGSHTHHKNLPSSGCLHPLYASLTRSLHLLSHCLSCPAVLLTAALSHCPHIASQPSLSLPLYYSPPSMHTDVADTQPVPLLVTLLGLLVIQSVTSAVVSTTSPCCCCWLTHGPTHKQTSCRSSSCEGARDCPALEAMRMSVSLLCWVCEHGPSAAAAAAAAPSQEDVDAGQVVGEQGRERGEWTNRAGAATVTGGGDTATTGATAGASVGTIASRTAAAAAASGDARDAASNGVTGELHCRENHPNSSNTVWSEAAVGRAEKASEKKMKEKRAGRKAQAGASGAGDASGGVSSAAASAATTTDQDMDVDECSPRSDREPAEGEADRQVLTGAKLQVLLFCCERVAQQLQMLVFVPVTAGELSKSPPLVLQNGALSGDDSSWVDEDVTCPAAGTHHLVCLIMEQLVFLLGALACGLTEALAVLTCSDDFWERTTRRLLILCSIVVDIADAHASFKAVNPVTREENKPIAAVGGSSDCMVPCALGGRTLGWWKSHKCTLFGRLQHAVLPVQKVAEQMTVIG